MPAIGDVLGGKYRVHAKLGEGGMGAVFRAENVVTGKHVAIKWMHPHVAARSEASSRLLREAQAASRMDHPNLVDVYDIVQDDKTVFMVMELLEGETLRAYLTRPEPAKVSELIALLLPAIDGVAVAHENGVIHRDLKPDNIFLARSRSGGHVSAKVLDFGVAKLATNGGLTLTETGMTMGTPLYMSLEQLRGDRSVDARTDVYALGAMLYEALAGVAPFQADTLPELVYKVATGKPRPLKELRSDLPTPLARLIDWAIERERDQRLPDLRAFIRELEPFARDRGFAQQMTNPDAEAPRLAVRVHDASLSATLRPLTAATDSGTRAPDLKKPEPDTFKARVIDTQQSHGKLPRLAWLAGAAALALAVAVTLWLRGPSQADPPLPAASLAPTQTSLSDATLVPSEPPTAAAPTGSELAPPSAAVSAALPLPRTADSAAEARPAAGANQALDMAKSPEQEPKSAPPPSAASLPTKPVRSARASRSHTPEPPAVKPVPLEPLVERPTQAGKTAAQVLGF